jgi:Cu-processing system ATP-binding protein
VKRLELNDVRVAFGSVKALQGVSLSIDAGEVLMLAGPNGAGKSTLMYVLLGLVRPHAGELQVDGVVRHIDNAFKSELGYLPDAIAFSDSLDAYRVLGFFARARGVKRARIDEVLNKVGLMHAAKRPVRGFSRGMRQRLGMAIAILAEPPLLILDEPSGGLDQQGLSVLFEVIAEWRAKGRMVLVSSHDLSLLERRVDRICVLREGTMIASGTPDALRRQAELPHRVRMQLGDASAEQATRLAEALAGVEACELTRGDGSLVASVPESSLVSLMRVQAQFDGVVVAMQVERPPLDLVYERLLEAS